MKRWMSVLLTVVMVVALVMSMSPAAFADDASTGSSDDNTQKTVTISMKLTGTKPKPAEVYDIKIEPIKVELSSVTIPSSTPDSVPITGEGAFTLGLTSGDSTSFPTVPGAVIKFDTVGKYTYHIYQIVGDNPKCHYDKDRYELEVYVTNNADYTGHEVSICIYQLKAILNSDGTVKEYEKQPTKVDDIVFTNKYWVAPANTPSTGDESNVVLYALVSVLALATLTTGIVVLKRKKQ